MGSRNEIAPGGLLRLVNIKMAALEPYRFEPERVRDVADDESSEDNELNERLESTFWCSCQRCEAMITPKECIGCVGIRNRKTRWKVHWHYVIVIVFKV